MPHHTTAISFFLALTFSLYTIENSMFSKYADAIIKDDFAYSGVLLGQKLEAVS
jgi:hypothetical protein